MNTAEFNGDDPTARRRLDREAARERDNQCWALHRRGLRPRAIGRELNIPASSVQRCLDRARKRADAEALGAPADVLEMMSTDLTAEDVAGQPELWFRLNPLERHRLRYLAEVHALCKQGHGIPPEHDEPNHIDCCIRNGLDPNWAPDQHDTVSWGQGVDRAMGRTDPDDDDWR